MHSVLWGKVRTVKGACNMVIIKPRVRFKFQASALKNFIPLFDRVLVQRLAAEAKTKGGVLIPEKSQGKVLEATVVAVGPGRRTDVSLCV